MHIAYVARDVVIVVRKVCAIRLLAVAIPFAGKNTPPANCLEAAPKPPNASEKINELECTIAFTGGATRGTDRAEDLKNSRARFRLPFFQSIDLALRVTKSAGSISN